MEWIKINSIDDLPKDGSKFVALYYGQPFIVQYYKIINNGIDQGNYFSLIAYDRHDDYEIDEDCDEHQFTHYLLLPPLP